MYINIALKRLEGCRTLAEGTKAIINLGLEDVPVPGEPGFPFEGLFSQAGSNREAGMLSVIFHNSGYLIFDLLFLITKKSSVAELFRNYLKQIREETSGRLLSCAYRLNGTPNKWWLAFAKRKFVNVIVL